MKSLFLKRQESGVKSTGFLFLFSLTVESETETYRGVF